MGASYAPFPHWPFTKPETLLTAMDRLRNQIMSTFQILAPLTPKKRFYGKVFTLFTFDFYILLSTI